MVIGCIEKDRGLPVFFLCTLSLIKGVQVKEGRPRGQAVKRSRMACREGSDPEAPKGIRSRMPGKSRAVEIPPAAGGKIV